MLSTYGKYTHAIVCRVPDNIVQSTSNQSIGDFISVQEARLEHENYVRLLRSLGLDVIELPADENLPDCTFVEDTAIVANGIALMCRPGE